MRRWQPADPLHHPDPLTPQQLAFHELLVSIRINEPFRNWR